METTTGTKKKKNVSNGELILTPSLDNMTSETAGIARIFSNAYLNETQAILEALKAVRLTYCSSMDKFFKSYLANGLFADDRISKNEKKVKTPAVTEVAESESPAPKHHEIVSHTGNITPFEGFANLQKSYAAIKRCEEQKAKEMTNFEQCFRQWSSSVSAMPHYGIFNPVIDENFLALSFLRAHSHFFGPDKTETLGSLCDDVLVPRVRCKRKESLL